MVVDVVVIGAGTVVEVVVDVVVVGAGSVVVVVVDVVVDGGVGNVVVVVIGAGSTGRFPLELAAVVSSSTDVTDLKPSSQPVNANPTSSQSATVFIYVLF